MPRLGRSHLDIVFTSHGARAGNWLQHAGPRLQLGALLAAENMTALRLKKLATGILPGFLILAMGLIAPFAYGAQICQVASNTTNIPAPIVADQLIYSPAYNRLVLRSSSAIVSIDLGTGQSATQPANANFTDMAISPSQRYVFVADYGGDTGYGTPEAPSYVHRLDLSSGIWEIKTAYIAAGIQVVSDDQFILRTRNQWITFTYNSWGTGGAVVPLNTPSSPTGPGYNANVYEGDFRYDGNSGRLLHSGSGNQAFKIVANEFVRQESDIYNGEGFSGAVTLATDGSAFYYGKHQLDALDLTHHLKDFPDLIFAATGNIAFGPGKLFDVQTGYLAGSLGFDARVYALNPNGNDFWTYDSGQNLLRHFTFGGATCPVPPAPIDVKVYLAPGTNNIRVSWVGVSGATGYNVYLAEASGVTKANYLSLGGRRYSVVTSPFTELVEATLGFHSVFVTAFNDSGESVESAAADMVLLDTQVPTVPTGLTATAAGHSQINLSWNASTDNVGVYYYQLYRGGVYLTNVMAPALSFSDTGLFPSTTYSYTVNACDGGHNCSANSGPASATTPAAPPMFPSAGYAPLPDNATWGYLADGMSYTSTVLPGTTTFGGVPVKQLQDSDDGSITYATNDANGIRVHGIYAPSVYIEGYGYTSVTTYISPPQKILDAQFFLGQTFSSSGTVSYFYEGLGSVGLSYTFTTTPVAFETVSVPAGTFNALRVDGYLRIYGSIGSTFIDSTSQGSDWWVAGLGGVKSISTSTDGTTTEISNEVLTSSSLLDAAPVTFSFGPLTNVVPGAQVTSNTITVQGVNAGVGISITGGQYSIDGGAWTGVAGTVFNGQSVSVRQTASSNYSTTTNATLTIGGVSGVFSVTTMLSYTLTIQPSGNGTVTSNPAGINCGATCTASYVQGTSVTLTATVDSGFSFAGWSGGGCSGTGTCAIVMNAPATITAEFLDTQAPTIPTGLTATAVSARQIDLSWNPSTDNANISRYVVYRDGAFSTTMNWFDQRVSDPWLTALTSYSYTIAACDAGGNCSAQSAPATATTLAPGQYAYSLRLEPDFNLTANPLNLTLDVAALFGNQDIPTDVTANVVSIWKWNAVDRRWAFYSPQLTVAGIASFAAAKGYEVLAMINPGEGYWVNALLPMALPVQSGTGFNWNSDNFAGLPAGFNLIAQANYMTPSEFNNNVSQTPPAQGVVPMENFVSLWVWDVEDMTWYFYSPLLEASVGQQGVKAYADSHFYRHFEDYGKTIGLGTGFWVNRP